MHGIIGIWTGKKCDDMHREFSNMKSIPTAELSAQLEKITAERDEFIIKIKEYEKLLFLTSESVFQYTEKVSAIFYQFSLDLKKIMYMNPSAEALCGHSREDIYKNPNLWFGCVHEEDRQNVIQLLSDMAENKKNEIMLEYRITMPNATIIYVSDRAVLINDKQGQAHSIMGFLTDLSGYINVKREMLLYDQILNVAQTEKSIEIAIETILKISCLSFGWDEGEVWLIEPSSSLLYCIKIWHRLRDEIKEFYEKSYQLKINLNQGFQGDVIRNNHPSLVTDYAQHKQYIRGDVAAKAGLTTAFGLPIAYQGKKLGVLIYFSKKVKNITNEQTHTLQRISDILADLIQNKMSKDQMIYMIHHDSLTGLVNRSGLEQNLKIELDKNRNSLLALIFVDLDLFKKINELMGFDIGDSVLKELATKFKECLANSVGTIANIGADQFVFVLSDLKRPEEIAPLLERIKATVNTPLNIKDNHILLTLSIGISIYPYDAIDSLSLLKNADIALNHAKSKGGDCVQYFSETLQKTVTNAIKMENALRAALTENELRLYYQPKVDLKTGSIIGVEALLRWQHPEEGLLLPASFISVAEQSDLIVYIGEWVLLEVCRHFPLADLQVPVAINFSTRQLKLQYDIVKFVKLLLEKLSLQPNLLEVEVTESQLMDDPIRSREVMAAFQRMGTSIALDDFGTGYSSFEYLKRFKPNRVKIDKSFIDGLPNDLQNAGIVKAIIALGKGLGIKIIAEGVENADQLRFLIDQGCDEMQGFYFSKPLPLYDIKHLIDSKIKLKIH